MHVRLLHVCPWFDSSSFLRGFSTCLINGTLVASKFCQSRMTILYPFIISDSVLERTWGENCILLIVSEDSVHHGGEGWQGSMSQHGSPESDQGECWSFTEPHTVSSTAPMHFLQPDSASSLLLLLGLCFSLLSLLVPALCSALWVSLFLLGALPLPLSIPLSSLEPDWSDRCLFSSQKHFFFLYVFSICGDACHSC